MPSTPPEEVDVPFQPNRGWVKRFAVACRGIKIAVRGEASFFVHLFVTAMAVLAGVIFGISRREWCLIILCISIVLCAELLNTSLERLARAISREENPDIRDALDIASGAVLVVSIAAAIVGLLVFGIRAAHMLT